MKGFRKGAKSNTAILDLATGELAAEDQTPPFVRPPWHRARLKFHFKGETRTQQSHRDTTNINNIVKRYERTGQLPPATKQGTYADVTGLQGDLTSLAIRSSEIREKSEDFATEYKAKKTKEKEAAKPTVSATPPPSPTEPPKA